MKKISKRLFGAMLAIIMVVTMVPNSVFIASAETAQSTLSIGNIVNNGSYPQTNVTDSGQLDALNLLTPDASEFSHQFKELTDKTDTSDIENYFISESIKDENLSHASSDEDTPKAVSFQSGPFTYEVTDSKATITNYNSTEATYSVNIPAMLGGYPVTEIGNSAFLGDAVCSVFIPDGVTTIGVSAFSNSPVTILTIPDSVTTIGQEAFKGCSLLTSVFIGRGVNTIGSAAFAACTILKQINVEAGNKSYSDFDGALFNTAKTQLIQFPGGKTGAYIIPEGVEEIVSRAFMGCKGLTAVVVPESVTAIGEEAFTGCDTMTLVCKYGSYAEMYANNNGITVANTGLFILNLPDNIAYTLGDPLDLTGLEVILADDDFNFSKVTGYEVSGYDSNISGTQTITVSYNGYSAMFKVRDSALDYQYVISGSAAKITGYKGASGASITIPAKLGGYPVTKIDYGAFKEIFGPTSVTIRNNVTEIGTAAFFQCMALTSVTIGSGVNTIGFGPFASCPSLVQINVDQANSSYCSENGVLFNITKTTLVQYPGGKFGRYVIPDGVNGIGVYAFTQAAGLTSISIPYGIGAIGDEMFAKCLSLTSVTIPGSLTSIGNNAFFHCTGLSSVAIPDTVLNIKGSAFNGCSGLTAVIIPASVTAISSGVFGNCPSVKIYCFENSTAHTYAVNNLISYELIHIIASSNGPGCNIDYSNNIITGLSGGITSLAGYFNAESGYLLDYMPVSNCYGTGTVVNVTKDGVTVDSYTVIIYGDVNGDGVIDTNDADTVINIGNYVQLQWDPVTNVANIKAGDLYRDGVVDENDYDIIIDVQNNVLQIDQGTGVVH